MKYQDLQISSSRNAQRVGRGIAAGRGKTAGRGTKGQKARTGYSRRPGFEGGQNPLMQRLPKLRGFRTFRFKDEVVFTGKLDQFNGKTIDTALLAEHGIISSPYVMVKLLNKGPVTKKITVKLQAASNGAIQVVEKAGGSFEQVPRVARVAKPKKTEKSE